MIRVEVIEEFTLERFDELKNIKRLNKDTKGRLYPRDTFECSKEIADYLTGGNPKKKVVVKVIEVSPEITGKVKIKNAEAEFYKGQDIQPDVIIKKANKKKSKK